MKIWLDILTPKQARLMHSIYSELKDCHKILVTSRKSAETQHVLGELGWQTQVIGGHGQTLKAKAENRFQRQSILTKMVTDANVDLHISHVAPSAVQVAYALGIPIILTNDTPWAKHVNTLTLPFTDYLVCSSAFTPKDTALQGRQSVWTEFCMTEDRIRYYNGVDEIAWVRSWLKTFKREKQDSPIITIRVPEYRAAYAGDTRFSPIEIILQELDKIKMSIQIQLLTRYPDQDFKASTKRASVTSVDYSNPLKLYSETTVFIGHGGTMNREAALLGIPSISIGYYEYVNPFVTNQGFPLMKCEYTTLAPTVRDIIISEEKYRTQNSRIFEHLESPVDPIKKLCTEFKNNLGFY